MRELTSSQVAAELGISAASIQRYARDGAIPFDQTRGGHRRFDLEEVRSVFPSSVQMDPTRAKCKVVVLTAKDVEYKAVCEQLEHLVDRTHANGTVFSEGELAGDTIDWMVAVAEIGPGNLGAAAEASAAIDVYKPDLVMFVGIAGGLKKGIPRGSVVVAERVYQYQSGRDAEDMFSRPISFPTDHALVQLAQIVLRTNWDWKDEQPIVVIKPIAAGELVLANTTSPTAELIRRNFNDAAAVDMESAGVYQAAHRARGVPALAIRGISDMLDDKSEANDSEWQPIAARNAARFAVALLGRANTGHIRRNDEDTLSDSGIDYLLARLPPTVADLLRDPGEVMGTISQVRLMASETESPMNVVGAIRLFLDNSTTMKPIWFMILAEYALAHGLATDARTLFEVHAEHSPQPAPSLIRAALAALDSDDIAGAELLLVRAESSAQSSGDRAFASMLQLHLAGKSESALIVAEQLDASNTIAQIVRSRILVSEGRIREARDLVTALVRDHPKALAGLMLEASKRLIQARAQLAPEEGEHGHLQLAYQLAIEGRDQRRAWRGDSAEASVLAAHAAVLLGDYQAVLSLVLEPPRGQADKSESKSSELCQLGCYAALQTSQPELVRELVRRVSDPVEVKLIELACDEIEGTHDPELVSALTRVVRTVTSRPDQIARALFHLARHNAVDESDLERLDREEPGLAQVVRARIDLIGGRASKARRRLKGLTSPIALDMMSEISIREGRVDDAVLRLRERFIATENPIYLAEAAEHLIAKRRFEAARDLVIEGLAVGGISASTRNRLELLAVQIFGFLYEWALVQHHARAILVDDAANADVAWALVFALHNQRDLSHAFEIMRKYSLSPRTEDEATCALMLWRQCTNFEESIDAAFEISRTFPNSETVVGMALLTSLELSGRSPKNSEPENSIGAAISEMSEKFFDSWPVSNIVQRIVTDSPEEMIQKVQDLVRRKSPPPELLDLINSAIRGMAPLGMAAVAAGKPLLEILIQKVLGPVLISSSNPTDRALEDIAAADAIDGEVVCDVHCIVVLGSLSEHRQHLLNQFARARLPMQVLDDVLNGTDKLQMRSTGTMNWDSTNSRLQLTEITNEQSDSMVEESLLATQIARDFTSERVNLDEAFSVPKLGVILAPIELARHRGIPLWSDDPGLRRMARAEGVKSFGTVSLVNVLVQTGEISAARAQDIQTTLLDRRFDLEVPTDVLTAFLKNSGFQFPQLGVLERRTVWIDPARGLATFHAALAATSMENREVWMSLVSAAAYGAAMGRGDSDKSNIIQSIGLSALLRSNEQVAAFPVVLDALRRTCKQLTLPDPLVGLVNKLKMAYEEELPQPSLAVRVVLHLTSGLTEEDHRTVAEALLR